MADVQKEIALKVTTDTSQTVGAFKSAQDELKQTQKALVEMSLAGKQGTAEFKAMEKRAGQLKDAIGDVNTRVTNLANDTPKLQMLTQAATGIAAGFAVAQGAAALFGDENEDVQKAIMKTQAAMSLLNGVNSIATVLNKDAALGDMLAAKAKNVYTFAIGKSTGAMKLFRLALLATGIGAVVVLIAAAAANFDKFTAAVNKFVSGSAPLIKALSFIKDTFTSIGEALGFVEDKTTKNLRTQIQAAEKQKRLLEAQGKDTAKVEREILVMKLDLANKTKEGVNEAAEAITLFDAKEKFKREEADKKAAEKQGELTKAATAKAKEAAKAATQIQLELNQTLEDLQAQNIANEEARALTQLELERGRARQQLVDKKASQALLDEFDAQTATKRKSIEDQAQAERDAKAKENADKVIANQKIVADALQQARLDSIKNEFDRAQAELEIKRQAKIEELTLAGASNAELLAVQQSFADKELEILKASEKQKFETRQQVMVKSIEMTMNALGAITSLFTASLGQSEKDQKKAFEANKKFSIAQALISTFLAVNNALTAGGNPIKLATGAQFVEAGIALTAGLANVIKIRNTQFQSTSAPSASSVSQPAVGGGGTQQPPAAFSPNVSSTNPTGELNLQGGQDGTTRVIVVESDIRRVTTRVDAAERFATFGN